MLKRIAAGIAAVAFLLTLGAGVASATAPPMTHNSYPGMTHNDYPGMTHNEFPGMTHNSVNVNLEVGAAGSYALAG